jgi:phosphopantetheinyl transferase
MSLLRIIENPRYRLGLYSIDGTLPEDPVRLNTSDREIFNSFTCDRRKREFLAVRALLHQMTSGRGTIVYNGARKPVLEGVRGNISISHSASLVAVLISDLRCGVDVEETDRKVDRIVHRFLCEEELAWTTVSTESQKTRIVCWSAKEAIFKWAGISETDFRRDIQIDQFIPAERGILTAIFRNGEHVSRLALNYFFELNNAVVWCVE